MTSLIPTIERLRAELDSHRRSDLKEYPTRVILIDPLLEALGWDVRDPQEVQLEYATIDGKSVDYALKINRKPVLFLEAKPINDTLTDVRSTTQVVSYAANAGVRWCTLTNGVTYKVYDSYEKAEAPDKLLFEVSIDPGDTEGMSTDQVAGLFERLSRDAMAKGLLEVIAEGIFTSAKVRKALATLFIEPPGTLVRLIRSTIGDDTIQPKQIRAALKRLWPHPPEVPITSVLQPGAKPASARGKEYTQEHHIQDKPQEVIELFRNLDSYCRELDPPNVQTKYLKWYVRYTHGKHIFCCIHLKKSGLHVALKLDYSDLENPPEFARDVSKVGHWGVGDVELAIDSLGRLDDAKVLILKSFEGSKLRLTDHLPMRAPYEG